MSTPVVLLIGMEEDIKHSLQDILGTVSVTEVAPSGESITRLDASLRPCLIITRNPASQDRVTAPELAKLTRARFKDVPSYLYFKSKDGFQKNVLIESGFTEVFLLPTDKTHFRSILCEKLAAASQGAIRFYRSVKLIDINPGDVLNFDTSLYLPANQKYVKLSLAGDSFDSEHIQRIKEHNFNSIQVAYEDLRKFYEYTAKRLKSIRQSHMTATEKSEKLALVVRELMSDLFADQDHQPKSNQEIMKDCTEIVKCYILQDSESSWYLRIEQVLGNSGDDYSHSANVSTLAALFSIGLGFGNPEELALAGLLHDIGITELPYEVQNTRPEDMTTVQMDEYKQHPDLTIKLLHARKITVSENVLKIIVQHHELYNGDGYPKGLYGDQIVRESQILAIADRFDELINNKDSAGKLLSPVQAVQNLKEEQLKNIKKIKYNPELLNNILALFPPKSRNPA